MQRTAKIFYVSLSLILSTSYASAQTQSFNAHEVCKAGIGLVMGRDVSTISAKSVENEVILNYTRPDGDKFQYKCVLPPNSNRVLWAAWIDGKWGRWRDTPADGELTYREDNKKLVITETMPSASKPYSKKYRKSDF